MSRWKISKTMSYLLRHDPEGMEMDPEGWVQVDALIERLEKRNLDVDECELRETVERDPKRRYELDEPRIRARYGHSIDGIDPTLTAADLDTLYHGTAPDSARDILREGLRKQGRQKVHLSSTVDEARKVGRRHAGDPIILQVDAAGAQQDGIRIERASSVVYVADHIPPAYISRRE
jgi:putative RNA 2'-phosphotransferase